MLTSDGSNVARRGQGHCGSRGSSQQLELQGAGSAPEWRSCEEPGRVRVLKAQVGIQGKLQFMQGTGGQLEN